jgi:DNA polymerase-1
MNFQIQSMAASIVNRAAIQINRELKKRGIDGYCCAQIHDQLIINVPEYRQDECKVLIQGIMENTTKLSLDLKAPPEIAINWSDGH